MLEFINKIDQTILDFIYENLRCSFLDAFMPIFTHLGYKGILFIAVGLTLLFFKKHRKTGLALLLALLIGFVVGNLFLKNSVCRARPYEINDGIKLLVARLNDYSFPSGHTLAAFEFATVITGFHRRAGFFAILFASVMAFSRLYLYVHFPTDVIAGAILGISVGAFSIFVVNKAYKTFAE